MCRRGSDGDSGEESKAMVQQMAGHHIGCAQSKVLHKTSRMIIRRRGKQGARKFFLTRPGDRLGV